MSNTTFGTKSAGFAVGQVVETASGKLVGSVIQSNGVVTTVGTDDYAFTFPTASLRAR